VAGAFDAMFTTFTPEYDAEGNIVGGTRLPHMPTTINGMPAGAPLGVYGGVDFDFIPSFDPFIWHAFAALAGTFTPYTEAELNAKYPTPAAYRALVTASADDLLARGYILQADRDAYANGALMPGNIPDVKDPMFTAPSTGGCTTTSGSGLSLLALLAAAIFVLRKKR
jgi:hypothetical protein